MRLLSHNNGQNQDNFAKTIAWASRKHTSIVHSITNVPVVEKEIFSVHLMPTKWGNLPK